MTVDGENKGTVTDDGEWRRHRRLYGNPPDMRWDGASGGSPGDATPWTTGT